MSNDHEYLVKYSVAPPPSRDYYGLKVLEKEIILYLWKISHGPHKAPLVQRAKFVEFDHEKSLQDEIRRGFGEHLLQHVKDIADGNKSTLLTLPKSLIERISRYLKFTDIVKLSTLSHVAYEVFNSDSLWQTLFKRDKTLRISIEEREKIKIYGWKQLYKGRQMQTSIKNRKNIRTQSSINYASDAKVNRPSLRPTTGVMPTSKISTTNTAKEQFSSTDLVTTSLSKMAFETRFRGINLANAENEKSFSQRKNSNSKLSMNERNVKKENFAASKANREIKGSSNHAFKPAKGIDSQLNRSEKSINKINANAKSQESKSEFVAPRTSPLSKSIVENVKSSSSIGQKSHGRTRSKTKTKSKKLATTKSEIFNADKELSEKSFMVRDGDDLADLIEASLKNIRSPRSIFDYDFSCVESSDARKNALRNRNEIQDIDRLKQLKPMRSSVISNYLSDRMIRGNEILEKLSEKSEPFSGGTSCDSLMNDKKILPGGDNGSLSLSEKYMKARAELQKSLDWKSGTSRSDAVPSENRWNSTTTGFRNKLQSSKQLENNDDKAPIPRGSIKTPFLMKMHNSKASESKKDVPVKNSITKIEQNSRRLSKTSKEIKCEK